MKIRRKLYSARIHIALKDITFIHVTLLRRGCVDETLASHCKVTSPPISVLTFSVSHSILGGTVFVGAASKNDVVSKLRIPLDRKKGCREHRFVKGLLKLKSLSFWSVLFCVRKRAYALQIFAMYPRLETNDSPFRLLRKPLSYPLRNDGDEEKCIMM